MKTLLVPTDFSTASKAGMRFAIQLATQMNVEPVFFYCFQALVPTTIHHERVEKAVEEQRAFYERQLAEFVAEVHKGMHVTPGAFKCVVVEGPSANKAILQYARQQAPEFICMSTRGAGLLRKLLGTHTSEIIAHAPVPVLAIPHTYRVRPIRKILYASDLEDVDRELAAVLDLAGELGARVDLAHFYYPDETFTHRQSLAREWRRKYLALNRVHFEPFDANLDLRPQLAELVRKVRPDLTVFFTHPVHTWFDKVFGSSNTESFSFGTKVPMLVYRKVGVESSLVFL